MAIVTEERQSSIGLVGIIIWLVILILIGVGTYYIFFKSPTQVGDAIIKPDSFKKAEEVSKIKLEPKKIEEGLKGFFDYIPWNKPEPGEGRGNPFQPV